LGRLYDRGEFMADFQELRQGLSPTVHGILTVLRADVPVFIAFIIGI
jgi:hypothetical protein